MGEKQKGRVEVLEERLTNRPDYSDALRRWEKAQETLKRYQKVVRPTDVQESTAGKWQPSEVLAQREYLEGT